MKKVLIGVSIGLNVLVLVLVLATVSGIATQWIAGHFLGATYDRWVSQFELMHVEPGDIVFLGDSITEDGAWHELFPGHPVRNRGIGGDTTAGVLARLHQITSGEPSKVFLLIGTNDLTMGIEVAEIVANIENIVGTIRDASPGTQIFVQSILPRGAEYQEAIETINTGLRRAIRDKAEWVNLYPLLLNAGDGSIRDEFSNDELHLMGEGYVLWRDTIGPLVSG